MGKVAKTLAATFALAAGVSGCTIFDYAAEQNSQEMLLKTFLAPIAAENAECRIAHVVPYRSMSSVALQWSKRMGALGLPLPALRLTELALAFEERAEAESVGCNQAFPRDGGNNFNQNRHWISDPDL